MDTKQKQLILLQHNGGRLANQLWLYAHVYAACLEMGFECKNLSFFEYSKFFPKTTQTPILSNLGALSLHFPRQIHATVYACYKVITDLYSLRSNMRQLPRSSKQVINLPPSIASTKHEKLVKKLMTEQNSLLLRGWNYKNPVGLKSYRNEIRTLLSPNAGIRSEIETYMKRLRSRYQKIVGVHIRQKDYKTFASGKFHESLNYLRNYLKTYADRHNTTSLVFLICSDDFVPPYVLENLPYINGINKPIHDLFLLTRCDEIFGSKSTYGSFAAYYGNIPLTYFGEKQQQEVLSQEFL